jgi:Phytanoyl-CoA dioxygenase (PhyH)
MTSEQLVKQLPDKTAVISSTGADEEVGYSRSFELTVNEATEIRDFFHEYGYVVIRNVLSIEAVEASKNEFFGQFDHTNDDAITEFLNRRTENPFSRMGIIGNRSDLRSMTQLSNRQNEQVYRAFAIVYDDPKLIVDHDRIGAMRPTLRSDGHGGGGGSYEVKSEWQTVDKWLHLDCNPATGEISIGSMDTSELLLNGPKPHDFDKEAPFLVQGFLALFDAREKDGGFLCVPGSHKVTKEWSIRNGWQHQPFPGQLRPHPNDRLQQHVQHITVRAGSLVIWNAFTLHANHPNRLDRWRLVQYIRMYSATTTRFKPLATDIEDYPEEFMRTMITPLGRRLFGIDRWDEENEDSDDMPSPGVRR